MIAIIDYGMGNLRSVQKAFEKVGAQAFITDNPQKLQSAERIVLPGVGAMKPAYEKLEKLNLIDAIKDSIKESKPFLGICLGLQLLFDSSDEGDNTKGLGILEGKVQRFTSLKVPHMGWNQINLKQETNPLFKGIEDQSNVYFCHSYFVVPSQEEDSLTLTDYGCNFTSSVNRNNIYGVQFHPEKSQGIGLKILENFVSV